MKYFIITFISFLVLSFYSCEKEKSPTSNSQGQINYLPYLWKFSLHKDGKFHSNSQIRANLVFDDKVLIGTTEGEGDHWLNAVNIETGNEIWKWNDIYLPPTEYIDINAFYENEGVMGYIVGSRHYAIDLSTGLTHWKIRHLSSFYHEMEGLGNTYFIFGQPIDTLAEYQTRVVFQGNFETGEIQRILVPNFSTEPILGNRIGEVTSVIPFIENKDTFLLVGWQNIIPPNFFQSYLGLYNLTQRQWIYEKAYLNEPAWNGVKLFPYTIYDDKVYMSIGYELLCHDLWTGENIWGKKFNAEIFFSGFIVEDGRVIANCEDKVLYCFDANSGNLLWKGEGAGTSSPLTDRYLNEVVYFSGGSSGLIHAVDVRDGKTLWKLEPEKMGDGAHFWKGDLYVIPGENGKPGKIIAHTPTNAYCFEAYR